MDLPPQEFAAYRKLLTTGDLPYSLVYRTLITRPWPIRSKGWRASLGRLYTN